MSLLTSSPSPDDVDLETSLEHCREALDLFFDNKFAEAKAIMEPWYVSSALSTSREHLSKHSYRF